MCKEAFSKRLVQLRMAKGVSARDMSLSLGQNPGYINSIENNKTFPSMSNFFEICDYHPNGIFRSGVGASRKNPHPHRAAQTP